jgi:hypothetical protein
MSLQGDEQDLKRRLMDPCVGARRWTWPRRRDLPDRGGYRRVRSRPSVSIDACTR